MFLSHRPQARRKEARRRETRCRETVAKVDKSGVFALDTADGND